MADYIFNDRKYDAEIYSLEERIRGQMNKDAFLVLYAIDKDVLIYAISIRYRDIDVEEIAKVVDDIIKNTFITEVEFKRFYKTLHDKVMAIVKLHNPDVDEKQEW